MCISISHSILPLFVFTGFQEAYKNMYAIVQVATNLEYFAKNIEAIADRNYVPSFEDILRYVALRVSLHLPEGRSAIIM